MIGSKASQASGLESLMTRASIYDNLDRHNTGRLIRRSHSATHRPVRLEGASPLRTVPRGLPFFQRDCYFVSLDGLSENSRTFPGQPFCFRGRERAEIAVPSLSASRSCHLQLIAAGVPGGSGRGSTSTTPCTMRKR